MPGRWRAGPHAARESEPAGRNRSRTLAPSRAFARHRVALACKLPCRWRLRSRRLLRCTRRGPSRTRATCRPCSSERRPGSRAPRSHGPSPVSRRLRRLPQKDWVGFEETRRGNGRVGRVPSSATAPSAEVCAICGWLPSRLCARCAGPYTNFPRVARCRLPGTGRVTSQDEWDADAGRVRIRRNAACRSGSARANAPPQSRWQFGWSPETRACDAQDAAALPRGLTSNAGRGQSASNCSRLGGKPRERSRSSSAKAARQTETWWFHPTYPRPS